MAAQTILTSFSLVFALAVLWMCICTLNYMTPSTPLLHRLSFILLGVGAASMLFGPLYFDTFPTVGGVTLAGGTALLLTTERLYAMKFRRRYRRRADDPQRPWWE